MILKFIAVCVIIYAILIALKFVEDSPIRSWKAVIFVGIPLCVIGCFCVQRVFPPPPPPQPRTERVSINKAELERTIRRIEGVDRAKIDGNILEINFAQPTPMEHLKEKARWVGGAAGYFLQNGRTNHVTVRMSVQGRIRYRLEYEAGKGMVDEEEY
jgi:hypothetical protein